MTTGFSEGNTSTIQTECSQNNALYDDTIYFLAGILLNKIAIQATAQMAADKEVVGLSRVRMYESKCILPL